MLIIQAALGIILAVLILQNLKSILLIGISSIREIGTRAALFAAVVFVGVEFPKVFHFTLGALPFVALLWWPVFTLIRFVRSRHEAAKQHGSEQ